MLESADFANVFQVVLRAERRQANPASPGKVLLDHSLAGDHNLKFIAFYLPQFHPIPENDEWWGKGFTEWSNTAKAQPLFPGHYQPHIPSDLGFYDLRLREVQHEQIAMAKRHGIDAFCFHYYWFNGRRLLERPLDDFLNDKIADIEFCLCWANESWSRRWNGSEEDLLIKQEYLSGSDIKFIDSVIPYFRDSRYLRIDGKPALVVYRPQHIPEPERAAPRWRDRCREAGIGEIHLIAALTFGNSVKRPDFMIEELGYDSGVEFPPHGRTAPNISKELLGDTIGPYIADYSELARRYLALDHSRRRVFRAVVPSWDNTPRRKELSLVLLNADPDKYEQWLDEAASKTILERSPYERLIFINAWNEWAEGCHLEPDQRFGTGYLEATSRVKLRKSKVQPLPRFEPSTQVSIGLRAELGRWGVRTFQRFPVVYSVARAIYRKFIKRQ